MINFIQDLKTGKIPEHILNEIGPFSIDAHNQHVDFLSNLSEYDVFGNRFEARPGLYHPHPSSSSIFMIRTLLREKPKLGRLLEIGCGTGAVGLSLLAQGLADSLVLTDIETVAVDTTRNNAKRLGLDDCVSIKHGSLFEPVQGEQFDSIVFNMPLMHRTHTGITHVALDDTNGEAAQTFFQEVSNYLVPGGTCFFPYSNISNPQLLGEFANEANVALIAAEWVVKNGFWLMIYRFCNMLGRARQTLSISPGGSPKDLAQATKSRNPSTCGFE